MTCNKCRMWDKENDHSGKCNAATLLKVRYMQFTSLLEEPGEHDFGLFVEDGYAELITGPLFGCVQFQLK